MKRNNNYIFLLVYLAYTSIYLSRVNLSVAGPGLKEIGLLDSVQIGLLGSVFSTVYAIGRLANGSLNDKNPPRMMLSLGLFAAGISNILIGFMPHFAGFFVLWAVNAYAQSMLWGSVLMVVSGIYTGGAAKKKASLMVTSVAAGNLFGIIINSRIINLCGESFAFFIPGAINIIIGIMILISVRGFEAKTEKKHISFFKLLKDKKIIIMTIPAAIHGIMKENISLWMALYVMDTYGADFNKTSFYILFIPVIGFLGRNIYPFLYKLFGENENRVSTAGFVVCIVSSVLLLFGGVPMAVAVLLLSLIYAAVSVINTSIVSIYPMQYSKSGNTASVSGIMDFATYLGAGVSSFIYGIAVKNFGYLPMFTSWAVTSAIALIILIKIKKRIVL